MHLGLGADIREIPSWCGWVPFSAMFSACAPYSDAELHQMTVTDAQQACRNAADPQQCAAAAIARGDQMSAAVAAEDPRSSCQLAQLAAHPTLAMLYDPCRPDGTTDWTTLYIGAAAVGLALLVLLRR